MQIISVLFPLLLSLFGSGHTLMEVIVVDATLSILSAAIATTEAEFYFTHDNSATVFAPTNDAFAALDPALLLSKYLEPAWNLYLENLLINQPPDP
jgi:uncharacterized surface protein with fasciclin (FAS1) repeats